jgi:hypothetical protein
MNRRNHSPGEFHPGNPGFQEPNPDQYGPDQYGQEHNQHYGPPQHEEGQHGAGGYGQSQHGQGQADPGPHGQTQYGQGQGPYGQGQHAQRSYSPGQYERRRYGAGPGVLYRAPEYIAAEYNYGSRYGSRSPARPEAFQQRGRDYGSREYGSFSQAPFTQQPSGHAPFSHAAFGESNEPHYFGTGSQGHGGGPSFTGGTYGYADERSDSPYFDEVGFNRDHDEEPAGRETHHQDWYRREAYPRQSYPYPRAFGTPGAPPQRRRYAMGPKGYRRSDERLCEDISERLMQSYDIDSSDVTVQVLGGKVVLEGTVPGRHMKHAIEDLADSAPGVQDVENRIRVVGPRRGSGGSRGSPAGASTASPENAQAAFGNATVTSAAGWAGDAATGNAAARTAGNVSPGNGNTESNGNGTPGGATAGSPKTRA